MTIKNKSGFTMMELLVVFILIAVLAQVAIVTYRNSIQNSKYDKGLAHLKEVGMAVERFRIDYPNVVLNSGKLCAEGLPAECNFSKYASAPINNCFLVKCGYLKGIPLWTDSSADYFYFICGDNTSGHCAGGSLAYMEGQASAGEKYKDAAYSFSMDNPLTGA